MSSESNEYDKWKAEMKAVFEKVKQFLFKEQYTEARLSLFELLDNVDGYITDNKTVQPEEESET